MILYRVILYYIIVYDITLSNCPTGHPRHRAQQWVEDDQVEFKSEICSDGLAPFCKTVYQESI